MRIRITADDRILEGTAKQIVSTMHSLAFGQSHLSLNEYIDWAAAQSERLNDVSLDIEGETDDERAQSLIKAMLATGLAEKLCIP